MSKIAHTNLSHKVALLYQNSAPSGTTVHLIPQDNGLWTVTIVAENSANANYAFSSAHADKSNSAEVFKPRLGKLSSQYESNGLCDAIGHDKNGGWSYGTYQIATLPGTMESFLDFLAQTNEDFYQRLINAGGSNAAKLGLSVFKKAWESLAGTPAFCDLQYFFIKSTHYDPFVKSLAIDLSLDLSERSDTLKDVAWSTAVQHGVNNKIFHRALDGKVISNLSDSDIVSSVYGERLDLDRNFGSSTEEVRNSLLKRFADEQAEALKLLG